MRMDKAFGWMGRGWDPDKSNVKGQRETFGPWRIPLSQC